MFLEGLILFLGVVYILTRNIPPSVYCQSGLLYSLLRTIDHSNAPHILGNIVALYQIGSIIQANFGEQLLITVITAATVLDILADYFLTRYFHTTCSIGYSGVIFALLVYLLTNLRVSPEQLSIIIGSQLLPGFFSQGVSNTGHLTGVVIGFVISFLIPV